jgi:hypothetical protein
MPTPLSVAIDEIHSQSDPPKQSALDVLSKEFVA